jgi:hypothetical protein
MAFYKRLKVMRADKSKPGKNAVCLSYVGILSQFNTTEAQRGRFATACLNRKFHALEVFIGKASRTQP